MYINLELINSGYYISDNFIKKSQIRTTRFYEIELYTTNNGASYVDGKKYFHCKGNLLINKPNQKRQSIGMFECYYVRFISSDEDFSNKYLDVLPQLIRTFESIKLINLFSEITDSVTNKQKGFELFVIAKLAELIYEIYNISQTYELHNIKYERYIHNIFEAVKFIQINFASHMNLSDIAKVSNLSSSYFHAVFKAITGSTPNKYLLDLRLKHAKKLLLNSNKSLADIALESGFESQVYMNYIFKKELNITPKQFKNTEKTVIF